MRRKLALLAVFGLLSACSKGGGGDGGGPIPSQQIANVAGTYSGTYSSSLVAPTTVVFTLAQNGSALTGTFNVNNGAATGTITGTVGVNTFTFTLNEQTPCSGTFNGSANVSGTSLSGTYTGVDCLGTHNNGVFSVSKTS